MRKLNVTDGQTDGRTGGRCNISSPGPLAPREIQIYIFRYLGALRVLLIIRVGPCCFPANLYHFYSLGFYCLSLLQEYQCLGTYIYIQLKRSTSQKLMHHQSPQVVEFCLDHLTTCMFNTQVYLWVHVQIGQHVKILAFSSLELLNYIHLTFQKTIYNI